MLLLLLLDMLLRLTSDQRGAVRGRVVTVRRRTVSATVTLASGGPLLLNDAWTPVIAGCRGGLKLERGRSHGGRGLRGRLNRWWGRLRRRGSRLLYGLSSGGRVFVVVVQVHIKERIVHRRSAATTIWIVTDSVVVSMMATVTIVIATAVVWIRAVVLAVHCGWDSITVQVCVTQTVRRRDDDGGFGRLQRVLMIVMAVLVVMLVVMMVVLVMGMVTSTANVDCQLIVSTVAAATSVIRPVIGCRRVLLVVNTTLGRVRRFQWWSATQTLRQVVVGHQSTGSAIIIVSCSRRVCSVRHHVATSTDANTAVDRTPTARVVVHSHVCRLQTYTTASIIT